MLVCVLFRYVGCVHRRDNFPAHANDTSLTSGCYSEQKAAIVLGFTEVTWDNWSGSEPQPATLDIPWENLTDDEKAAATYLGFGQRSWDTREPRAAKLAWANLKIMQQLAAKKLGYTETSWDNVSGDEVQPDMAKMTWVELNDQQRGALIALGYRQINWDNWPDPQPESFSKEYAELSSCGEDYSHDN